jgi:hypothetical protein
MMSEGKTPPRDLDAVLAAWPTAERTALEWDDSAEHVLSLIGSGDLTGLAKVAGRVSDEDLLRPPLPTAPDEVQSSAPIEAKIEGTGMTTTSRERDRAGFKDLARLANMTPPPSSASSVRSAEISASTGEKDEKKEWEENSGVINLAAIATSEAEAQEARTKAPAVAGSMSQATKRSAGNEPKPIAEAREAKREEKKKGSPWVAIGGVVAAAAVAAGVFFGMQHTDRAASPATVALAPQTPANPVAAAQNVAAAAATASPTPPVEHGVDPSSLPPASTVAVAVHAAAVAVPPKPGPVTTAPTQDPALVAAIPTATAVPSATASLQAQMQQAAGVTSSPTPTAATANPDEGLPAPGSVPIKPSQGAIQGSLGAALPSARGCLGPDDPISHATITFKSDGSVQSVGVTGGAAGKPAEGCIRAALSKARVAPFAQPTFTATATVRPN